MAKPIRILHVFAQMNRGGAETMIMNIYRKINRCKIQFDFIVHTKEECSYDEEIRQMGGRIFRIPSYEGRNHFDYVKEWKHFFQRHPEYKIIHGHVRSTASIYLSIAKKHNIKTIAHSHSTSSGSGYKAIVKNLFQYPIRYISDYFFACSEVAGEWLFGSKITNQENFFIINNAIDAKKFIFNKKIRNEIRDKLRINDRFVIGHVGRFQSEKNHEFLIDTFKKVHNINDKALLLLVGDGVLIDSIKKKVALLGLEKDVIFAGESPNVSDYYQAMDVFVFPSLYEGLGLVIVEAQAAGLQCIVSDTIPEEAFITDLVSKLSLDNPIEVWVNKILSSARNSTRKNTFTKIKNNKYDIEDAILNLERIYNKIYGDI